MSKSIYILGGMGPQASIELYRLITEYAQKYYSAENNDDYPETVLHSVPVPDFISNESNRVVALEMLKQITRNIPKQSRAFTIACNTAHLLGAELQEVTEVPFLSMIESVAKELSSQGFRRIGLMSSTTTLKTGLYQVELKKFGIEIIEPSKNQLEVIEEAIRGVLANKNPNIFKHRLEEITAVLMNREAEITVLGCTELPVILKDCKNYISSTSCLAKAIVDKYYK